MICWFIKTPRDMWRMVYIGLLVIAVFMIVSLLGCSTFPKQSYQVLGASQTTVFAAMRAWDAYLAGATNLTGEAEQRLLEKERMVKEVYERWRMAQRVAIDATLTVGYSKSDEPETARKALRNLVMTANELASLVNKLTGAPIEKVGSLPGWLGIGQ